jgi:hypothetical protein
MRHGASGDEWYGMIVGGDDLRVFAVFADDVVNWAIAATMLT